MTIAAIADERGKHGAGIEARPAQPVDRAVAADQRGGLAVPDQRVVLDATCHGEGLQTKVNKVNETAAGGVPCDRRSARKSYRRSVAAVAAEGLAGRSPPPAVQG